jgi:beta-lactamase regulating signal transducer with metallopeptidase domain
MVSTVVIVAVIWLVGGLLAAFALMLMFEAVDPLDS